MIYDNTLASADKTPRDNSLHNKELFSASLSIIKSQSKPFNHHPHLIMSFHLHFVLCIRQ